MKILTQPGAIDLKKFDLYIISATSKKQGEKVVLQTKHWPKDLIETYKNLKDAENFHGSKGETFKFYSKEGTPIYAVGLGDEKAVSWEDLRRSIASAYKATLYLKPKEVAICLDSFTLKNDWEKAIEVISESIGLAHYNFIKYKKNPPKETIVDMVIQGLDKKHEKKAKEIIDHQINLVSCINLCRDLVNEAPNILRAPEFAKRVEEDAKKNLKGVKVKVLGRKELEKENMYLFLSVNDGSAFDAKMVHLTYTPKKVTSKTKHIALVGKGLVFDTGGYSLKPSDAISNMKFDMGGAATVYAAFRSAVQNNCEHKITCILGMTDNAISGTATFPDSVVKARNGKSVEILNTDAEGRLVLADCLDYVSDLKPDAIIDAATLTGACLVALGSEICGLMGNSDKLMNKIKTSATEVDEYIWQLPIIPEWSKDMKSQIADLRNIGTSRFGGTGKAAAFLQEFIGEGIEWAHLDIAGVCDSQSHLPYCPPKGGSGIMVRTLSNYLMDHV